jgi:hypothetical protein
MPRLGYITNCHFEGRAKNGRQGATGKVSEKAPEQGSEGPKGQMIFERKSLASSILGDYLNPYFLKIVLRSAELDYINSSSSSGSDDQGHINILRDKTCRKLIWLSLITNGHEQFKDINNRCSLLLRQLQSGLDFYGNSRNFVTLVAKEYYESVSAKLNKIGSEIERQYNQAQEQNISIDRIKESGNQAILESEALINSLEEEKDSLLSQRNETMKTIEKMLVSINQQELVLRNSEDSFKEAVSREAKGCDFNDVLQAVKTVVTIANVAWGDIKGIVSSTQLIFDSLNGDEYEAIESNIDKLDFLIKNFKSAGDATQNHFQSIKKSYDQIKSILTQNPDAGKVAIDRENFEEVIKPYLSLEAAQKYKSEIEYFLDLVEARNSMLLECDGLLASQLLIDDQIRHQRSITSRLRNDITSDLAENSFITQVKLKNFLEDIYSTIRDWIIRHLYQQHRAFEYWEAELSEFFHVSDQSITSLSVAYGNFLVKCTNEMENRGRELQRFTNYEVKLNQSNLSTRQWQSFRETGILIFNIKPDHPRFRGMALVQLHEVAVKVEGVETSDGELRADLIHTGNAKITRLDKELIEFSHPPRVTRIHYKLSAEDNVSVPGDLGYGENRFACLTPYAQWILDLRRDLNPGLCTSEIKIVRLSFDGKFYPI